MHKNIAKIKEQRPLIHNMNNIVTMDIVANGLLALGASPIMAHAKEELKEIVAISSAVYINIGTLDEAFITQSMEALTIARGLSKVVVLDPVGAGATNYRTSSAQKMIETGAIKIVKGNASEIIALNGERIITRGVDSSSHSNAAFEAAQELASRYNIVVVVTGETDIIVSPSDFRIISSGDIMMTKVTGIGCLLGAVISAFAAVNENYFESSCNACEFFGQAAIKAINDPACQGPASFRQIFIDSLYKG